MQAHVPTGGQRAYECLQVLIALLCLLFKHYVLGRDHSTWGKHLVSITTVTIVLNAAVPMPAMLAIVTQEFVNKSK